jgi:hypothetical protein
VELRFTACKFLPNLSCAGSVRVVTAKPFRGPRKCALVASAVTLSEDAGDTILTLRHTGIPNAFADMHAAGWTHFLARLAVAADAGPKPG